MNNSAEPGLKCRDLLHFKLFVVETTNKILPVLLKLET